MVVETRIGRRPAKVETLVMYDPGCLEKASVTYNGMKMPLKRFLSDKKRRAMVDTMKKQKCLLCGVALNEENANFASGWDSPNHCTKCEDLLTTADECVSDVDSVLYGARSAKITQTQALKLAARLGAAQKAVKAVLGARKK